ncbi:hypothetical protein Tco_1286911, partial [Tanacetum coccineum]
NMADENVPALAPTRIDDQILPFAAWVSIRKSNFVLDLQKKQKNPIFQISMDIIQNTNFFRAFTASAFVPAIYIQQFWNILAYEAKTGAYSFQSGSLLHLAKEDLRFGNLKFVPKGEDNKVFGMPLPNELITNKFRNAPYYNAYLEMVAKHDWKIAAEKGGKKKPTTAKQLKPKHVKEKSSKPAPAPKPKCIKISQTEEGGKKKSATKADKSKKPATAKQLKPKPVKEKSSKPAPAPKPKVTKEKLSKPSPAKHLKRGKVQKLCKGKSSLQLIDEDEPTLPEPEPEPERQGEGEEYDVERAIQMSLESF